MIDANRLEFPSVQKAVEHFGSHMDLSGFAATLKCDFLLLSYLLQYANNLRQRITWEERFLILYFHSNHHAVGPPLGSNQRESDGPEVDLDSHILRECCWATRQHGAVRECGNVQPLECPGLRWWIDNRSEAFVK